MILLIPKQNLVKFVVSEQIHWFFFVILQKEVEKKKFFWKIEKILEVTSQWEMRINSPKIILDKLSHYFFIINIAMK